MASSGAAAGPPPAAAPPLTSAVDFASVMHRFGSTVRAESAATAAAADAAHALPPGPRVVQHSNAGSLKRTNRAAQLDSTAHEYGHTDRYRAGELEDDVEDEDDDDADAAAGSLGVAGAGLSHTGPTRAAMRIPVHQQAASLAAIRSQQTARKPRAGQSAAAARPQAGSATSAEPSASASASAAPSGIHFSGEQLRAMLSAPTAYRATVTYPVVECAIFRGTVRKYSQILNKKDCLAQL